MNEREGRVTCIEAGTQTCNICMNSNVLYNENVRS